MIFKYDIKIPLTYNKSAIQLKNPDSELCYELENLCEETFQEIFITFEIPDHRDGCEFYSIVKVRLRQNIMDNISVGNTLCNDDILICEIEGMLVDDEIYARKFSEEIVDKICKRLSFIFIKHNVNRHLYQPRVEPVWSKAIFTRHAHAPFVAAKHKVLEEKKDNNTIVCLEDHMSFQESLYSSARISIPSDEIKIRDWLSKKNDVIEFLTNEYYIALGTENVKSKFFHLFSIIEFCENEYEEHNGASSVLSEKEVTRIVAEIEKQIDGKKRDKIIPIVKSNLVKANDIGRAGKLENILKWMGIEKYNRFGEDKSIDKKLLTDIIILRNKSFHGTKETIENVEKTYGAAVEVLLYIDEKILDFLMEYTHQKEIPPVCLVYGKK